MTKTMASTICSSLRALRPNGNALREAIGIARVFEKLHSFYIDAKHGDPSAFPCNNQDKIIQCQLFSLNSRGPTTGDVMRGSSNSVFGHYRDSRRNCKRGLKGRRFSSGHDGDTITVTFVDKDGDETLIKDAPVGESMLEIAHANDVELEGACEGSLACSTCHIIVDDEDHFDILPEPSDDENDMLDLAFGLTET